ncbi:MAG: response regulator transcription factor [Gammaproteobacteria bacterium]|nr:response regulator transcription factor [Gammaproteobacteria bacterium]
MSLIVYSKSLSFEAHINSVIDTDISFRHKLSPAIPGKQDIFIVHAASFKRELEKWLNASTKKGAVIAIAADEPELASLLEFTQWGVQGYFNSYMGVANYAQMTRLLANGQSWFPPTLLNQAFEIARSVTQPVSGGDPLEALTKREKQIALAVAEGQSNKLVATNCDITERTVKAHLTQIYKKLQVKDRVALVIYLNNA